MLHVPAQEYIDEYWVAESDGMASRSAMAAASGPYRSSVPPSIATWAPSIPADLTANTEEATAALSRFDSYAAATLGAVSPTLGPMSAILLRTESTSSSQIENLTVGARQLALAELDQSSSENARTVVANVRAMEAALDLAERFDTSAILAMHRALLSGQRGWEDHAGRWREQLVWIGTSALSPRGASHVAPQAPLVAPAMEDLVHLVAREDLPVLVQAAVAHAQFETIHPFTDGNGRTGRAIVHSILRAKGITTTTIAPVSAGLLTQTEQYFDALTAYRDGDARPIVERFSDAARFAATSGSRLVDDLAEQVETSRAQLHGLRSQAAAWTVLPHLVSHPIINARFLTSHLGMGNQSAHNALAQLADAGVLVERTGQRRNRVWQHPGVLTVLDEYARMLLRQ
ncbi:Fic family protein [Isoptericola sp. S6320L]|uniref:Fic family protein n=1 Tax=Isoptericola sp. S6320L TaxID=2926411 RepID=UPI001FF30BB6|nr:Fic family protein [Isoptericola sp. S6320L]MCK0117609.1 Fic family protein [Isoptericola sp. S6320L]